MNEDRNSIYNMRHFFMWIDEDMMGNDTEIISYGVGQGT